jgi:hypothetical protein
VVEDVLFEFVNHYRVADKRGKYRDTNLYCVPWSQCRMNLRMVRSILANVNLQAAGWQKYTALNLKPIRSIGTVEWRHLHGSADTAKITTWLNLIGSIMKYASAKDFEEVAEVVKKLNDNSAYRSFFNDVLGWYLPFEQSYEVALADGVVNAKYSLIGLKEKLTKEEEQAKAAAVENDWNDGPEPPEEEEEEEEEQAGLVPPINRPAGDPIRRRRPAPGFAEALRNAQFGGVYQAAPREPAPVREAPRRNERAARAAGAAAPGHIYPLKQGTLYVRNVRGLDQPILGFKDAFGRYFLSDGRRQMTVVRFEDTGTYVKGPGLAFWELCDADWRPVVIAQQAGEEV